MAGHPFLKSIRPVNLLSFGPDTPEIELRPLNILIGPNGSGKSNFIEIIGLLKELPDKDPWSTVLETGGVDEWIWKGSKAPAPLIGAINISYESPAADGALRHYEIRLAKDPASFSFRVDSENLYALDPAENRRYSYINRASQSPDSAQIRENELNVVSQAVRLDVRLSLLSQLSDPIHYGEVFYLKEKLAIISLYRDWVFGVDANPRSPQPVGLDSRHLEEDTRNLAQVLKAWRDRGELAIFNRVLDSLRQFYEPIKDVDVELVGTHLRILVREEWLRFRTPATRLSDGTLRWLALLIILLDPTPPPVICIDEPDLGLHPDMIPTLADLLRDASTRTQLVVTTHSTGLVDAFSDTPEVVCVCEKVEGATQIRRLDAERLAVWMEDYSLGSLWASGEIGGNRW